MSYISRLALDETKRDTLRAMINPQMFHAAIEAATSKDSGRNLWRIDKFQGKYWLLLVSSVEPDLSSMVSQFGLENMVEPAETKDYEPFLNRLRDDQVWQFRLRGNPVRSVKSSDGKRGKIYAHVTPLQQKQWLLDRAESYGFKVDLNNFDVVNSKWHKFDKASVRNVTIRAVTFEGFLTITDREKFVEMLQMGLGRGKAYGCGLMTIMRRAGD